MSHKFTTREKVLLLFLVVLAIICSYYLFVMKPVSDRISQAETKLSELDSEMIVESVKNKQLLKMEEELGELKGNGTQNTGILAAYDNVQNVLRELNEVLANVDYNLTFNPVAFEDKIAHRTINMTFTANNYNTAKLVISRLYASKYRCNITSLSIIPAAGNEVSDIKSSSVSIKLTVTFLEYIEEKK